MKSISVSGRKINHVYAAIAAYKKWKVDARPRSLQEHQQDYLSFQKSAEELVEHLCDYGGDKTLMESIGHEWPL